MTVSAIIGGLRWCNIFHSPQMPRRALVGIVIRIASLEPIHKPTSWAKGPANQVSEL